MIETSNFPGFIQSLSKWIHVRIYILELISVFVIVLLLYVNVRTEADLGIVLAIPVAFLVLVFYLHREIYENEDGISKLILRLGSYASITAILAIYMKYISLFQYDIILTGAVFFLMLSLIGIAYMKFRFPRNKFLTLELAFRLALLEVVVVVLYALPNEKLLGLGFAVNL